MTLNRRDFLWSVASAGLTWCRQPAFAQESEAGRSRQATALVSRDDLEMMRDLTVRLLQAGRSAVRIGGETYPVYLPSGSGQYPAFWTRDAAWIAQSGLVPAEDIRAMLQVLALSQNGAEVRRLEHGLRVPAWAIADHVLREGGGGVFFPGTYSAGSDQGNGSFGLVAAQDASYEFIELGWLLARLTGDPTALRASVGGVSLIGRMQLAFDSPEADEATQLARTTKATRAVAFSDAIVKTGFLLEGSVLRWRAARQLHRLHLLLRETKKAERFLAIARTIERHFVKTFWHETEPGQQGWLFSATETGRQDCVRGTCFAIAFGLLTGEHATMASRALASASATTTLEATPRAGQISYQAHVRHLRAGEHWQRTSGVSPESYQNGGYWSMFTGWFARALELASSELAKATAQLFVEHLRRYSFHNGVDSSRGAPWEWIHPDGRRKGPRYLAGLTLPYRGFKEPFQEPELAQG